MGSCTLKKRGNGNKRLHLSVKRLKPGPKRMEKARRLASIVPGVNRFSQKLFEHLCLEKENNLVISPVGISILLAMVADGARGQSLEELQSILALPKRKIVSNTGYKDLVNDLKSFNKSESEIRVVNKIITSDELRIKKQFRANMSKYFSSSILAMDWNKLDKICERANKFCKEKTNGRITSILTPSDVPNIPSVILLNAVYLKSAWANRFEEKFTKAEPFHVSSKLEVEVSMMHKRFNYNSGEIPELDATFVVLPFKTDNQQRQPRIKMMVFLPNELNGIRELEQYLSTVDYCKLLETSISRDIYLSLPKFRAENLNDVTSTLKKMGLRGACNMEEADFTGVSGTLPLCIDKVIQKTFLDVNEMGVEAAAFTYLSQSGGGFGGTPPPPPLEFKVNRPFLCAVIVENHGIPIFLAKITNPTL